MGSKRGFTFLLVQTFLVNSITAVLLDEDSQEKDSPHSLDDVLILLIVSSSINFKISGPSLPLAQEEKQGQLDFRRV